MSATGLSFSHVGIFVYDMATMTDFYSRVLDFTVTDHGHLGPREVTFFSRDPAEHHQIVLASGRTGEPTDRVINQISFRVASLAELRDFHARIVAERMADIDPVFHGNAWSVYFRDPEGNRVEVFADSDWYVKQPMKVTIDLTQPEAEIRSATYALCKDRPGFQPIEEWRRGLAKKMAERAGGRD